MMRTPVGDGNTPVILSIVSAVIGLDDENPSRGRKRLRCVLASPSKRLDDENPSRGRKPYQGNFQDLQAPIR